MSVLYTDFNTKRIAYRAECASEAARLNQLLIPVLIAMREELELAINEDVLVQAYGQGARRMEEIVKESLENAQRFTIALLSEEEEQS